MRTSSREHCIESLLELGQPEREGEGGIITHDFQKTTSAWTVGILFPGSERPKQKFSRYSKITKGRSPKPTCWRRAPFSAQPTKLNCYGNASGRSKMVKRGKLRRTRGHEVRTPARVANLSTRKRTLSSTLDGLIETENFARSQNGRRPCRRTERFAAQSLSTPVGRHPAEAKTNFPDQAANSAPIGFPGRSPVPWRSLTPFHFATPLHDWGTSCGVYVS